MKRCKKCGLEKKDDCFRIRKDKRLNPVLIYRNGTCLQCEADRQREYSRKARQTQEGKQKHNRWALEFHRRNREKCLAKMRERRESDYGKVYRRKYDTENKDRIAALSKERNRKYVRKNIEEVRDAYVIKQLSNPLRGGIDRQIVKENPQLIEAAKALIILKRKIYGRRAN